LPLLSIPAPSLVNYFGSAYGRKGSHAKRHQYPKIRRAASSGWIDWNEGKQLALVMEGAHTGAATIESSCKIVFNIIASYRNLFGWLASFA